MGPESSVYHKALAEKISEKTDEKYSTVINYIHCKLSFMCVRSALLCLRWSGGPTKRILNTERNRLQNVCPGIEPVSILYVFYSRGAYFGKPVLINIFYDYTWSVKKHVF